MTRVAGLPGVRMVGGINEPPLAGSRMPNQPISREGQPLRTAAESPQVIQQAVTPDYFRVMGIPLRKGRFFTEADAGEGRFPAIVNETAARLYWPGQDPLGKRFAMGSLERLGYFRARGNEPEWREIVGVVADVRSSGLDVPAQPEVFYSYRQFPWYGATLVARAEGDAARLAAAIRRETLALHRRAVITEVRTMRQIAADSVAQPRFRARLVGLFSALALLLGMLGIYGVTSYTVAQRTHEIGIRMALGATAGRVSRMVFGQSMRVTAIGLALGIACALIAARWISSLLYGVTPWDPVALAAACLALAGATLGASYLPARRAARVDPAVALRAE
ncbi:MAG: ABC transporter permease [Candidatus Solibacter usitatus]|nr:ABC transporter permease [Candidatus Solibacter usitatus]